MTKMIANNMTRSTKTEKALSMPTFHQQFCQHILSITHCDSISGMRQARDLGALSPHRTDHAVCGSCVENVNVDSNARFSYSTCVIVSGCWRSTISWGNG